MPFDLPQSTMTPTERARQLYANGHSIQTVFMALAFVTTKSEREQIVRALVQ